MNKINAGLIGIFIIIISLIAGIIFLDKRNKDILDEVELIRALIQDLDEDLHDMKDNSSNSFSLIFSKFCFS